MMFGAGCAKSRGSSYLASKNPVSSTPIRDGMTKTVRTTAYSHMENEPGAYGKKTAIGSTLRYGRTRSAAADWSIYPMGTEFKIVGEPHTYVIEDYGSALVGKDTIDLYKPNLRSMNEWGVRHVEIKITKMGSYHESAKFLENKRHHSHCNQMYHSILRKMR